MEKIKAAAIKYRVKGKTEFQIVYGVSHSECINALSFRELPSAKRDMTVEQQGFLTTTGRFVDRVAALVIAKQAGQVPFTYARTELLSEYIDWRVCND